MKHLLIFILVATVATSLSGQMKYSVDILGGYNGTFRVLDGNGRGIELLRESLELYKGNVHLGFNFNIRLTENIYYKVGLRYASMGYKTKSQMINWGSNPGMITTSYPFTYDYQFIEIPFNCRVELEQQAKFIPFFELGVAPMFLFGNKKVIFPENNLAISSRSPLDEEFNKLHLALNVNLGVNYLLGAETILFTQAVFRGVITSLTDSKTLKEYLYGSGVELGVRRSIFN